MPESRLCITGTGVVFPGGVGPRALLDALREVKPALGNPQEGELRRLGVEADLKALVHRKGLPALSRSALLAAAAIDNLIVECPGILPEALPGECGLVVGTAFGHVESKANFHRQALDDGVRLVSPIVFPNTLINSLAGHAAILYGLTGPNSTVTSGRRSGLEALLRAASLIRARRAQRVIAAGCDEISPSLLRALEARRRQENGKQGFPRLLGEASAAVLLEPEASARACGRAVRAVFRGMGERSAVGCGLHEAIRRAMAEALQGAEIEPDAIRWVIPSRSGPGLDEAEAGALATLFKNVPETDLKGLFGESFGASGVVACVAAVALARERPGPMLISAVEEDGATSVVLC